MSRPHEDEPGAAAAAAAQTAYTNVLDAQGGRVQPLPESGPAPEPWSYASPPTEPLPKAWPEIPDLRNEIPSAPTSSSRISRLGSWILHPASNWAARRTVRNLSLGMRMGTLLEDQVATGRGDDWESMDRSAQATAIRTAWEAMDQKAQAGLRRQAKQEAWEAMTPAQRLGHRIEDVGAVGASVILASALVLRALPGSVGAVSHAVSKVLHTPGSLPDIHITPNGGSNPSPTPDITSSPEPTPPVIGVDPGGDGGQPVVPSPELPVFTPEQLSVDEGMGAYELFNKLGLTNPHLQHELLAQDGDALVKAGVAYRDPAIGGYGLNQFGSDGQPLTLTASQAQSLVDHYNALRAAAA